MRKHFAIACLGALLGCSQMAAADSADSRSAQMPSREMPSTHRVDATDSLYPKAWCIETFLTKLQRPAGVRRPAPTAIDRSVHRTSNTLTFDEPTADLAATAYTDRSSLSERLKSLKSRPLATLWRGRETALVLRMQNGGYFGVSIDDTRYDAD